ncbi:hypothetical protein [Streptomyces sp. CC224B]|uniref:hypothetical protein n=1 Tax=Streptomyces sp. CC224B TaxID=3044571 RepID=UPI0024A84BE4|nr:hypothetical protein [Streptomyces sp. CC224B]
MRTAHAASHGTPEPFRPGASTLECGAVAVCTATRHNGAGYDVRLEACGAKGALAAGLDERGPLPSADGRRAPTGPVYADLLDRFAHAFRAELRFFLRVAAGKAASPCTGEDALAALRVAEAAERSLRERRAVRVERADAAVGQVAGWKPVIRAEERKTRKTRKTGNERARARTCPHSGCS